MSTNTTKSSERLNVLLVGFGAVGAIYAVALKRSGHANVTVVARSNYDDAHKNGTHIKSGKYGDLVGWRPDRLCRSVQEAADKAYTHVLISTKNIPEVIRLPDIIAPLLNEPYVSGHPQPTYVVLQNGLNVEADLYRAIKDLGHGVPKIISAAVYIAANVLEDLTVEHGTLDNVSIGAYRYDDCLTTANTPTEDAMLQEFANPLNAGGGVATICPEIQRVKLVKNFWNVTFSSIATLTGWSVTSIFRPPPSSGQSYAPYVFPKTPDLIKEHVMPNVRALLSEVLSVGRAMGFPDSKDGIPSAIVDEIMEMTRKLCVDPNNNHKPSMMLDAENGRLMEVEVILGEVVRTAKRHHVDVPRIEILYTLLLVKQNQTLRLLEEQKKQSKM